MAESGATWEGRNPEWVVNAMGLLTPTQKTRVRAAATLRGYFGYLPLLFLAQSTSSFDKVGRQIAAVPGSLGRALTFGGSALEVVGFALVIVLMYRGLRLQLLVLSETGGRSLTTVQGTLRWHGRRYVADAGGLRLRVLEMAILNAPPGAYRLYYLPRSRVLAVAEREGEPPPYAEWHGRHPEFDCISLPFNREGRRSPIQFDATALCVLLVPWLIAYGAGVAQLFVGAPLDAFVVLTEIVSFVIAILLTANWRYFVNMRAGQVVSIEGTVERAEHLGKTGVWWYTVMLDGERFQVKQTQYDALGEPYRYRLYFAKGNRSHQLLSAEPIGEIAELAEIVEG